MKLALKAHSSDDLRIDMVKLLKCEVKAYIISGYQVKIRKWLNIWYCRKSFHRHLSQVWTIQTKLYL